MADELRVHVKVAQRVVDKGQHVVMRKPLQVQLYLPGKAQTEQPVQEEVIQDEPELPPCTIMVRSMRRIKSMETVRLYFENRRRSHGGEVTDFMIDEENDAVFVTFKEAEVAEEVTKWPHKVEGVDLDVSLYEAKSTREPEPEDYEEEVEEQVPSEPPRMVKVTGIKKMASLTTLQYYFENSRRSGGGELEEDGFHVDEEDENVLYLKFVDENDAQCVANRSHVVDRVKLEIEMYIPPQLSVPKPGGRAQQSRQADGADGELLAPAEPPRIIKIRGIKKMMTLTTLEYYFENKRRSGGGELEPDSFHVDEEDDDLLFITFKDENDAQAVADRSHCVEGVHLEVELYIPPPPPKPRPQYTDRALFCGVKPTTTKDCLLNFLEAKTGVEPRDVIYGETEGTVLVTFESDPDFDRLQDVCQRFPLEGASISVSTVPISNCIMVSNLVENTSKETVQYYFENKRRSGGGDVEKIDMCEDGVSCLVFFCDHEVVDNVLNRTHKIDRQLKVRLHVECLGNVQADGGKPVFKVPPPLQLDYIDEQKIKFMKNSDVNKGAIEMQLTDCHAKITWPEKKSNNVTIECTLTDQEKDCFQLAKTWKEVATKNFEDFLKNIEVVQHKVQQSLWNKVMERLQDIQSDNPDAVAVFVDKDQCVITAVGMKKMAQKVGSDINNIIKKVVDEAEQAKQIIRDDSARLKPIQTKMLLAAKFPTKMEAKYANLKVKINHNRNEILFEGMQQDVQDAKINMFEMANNFASGSIPEIKETCAGLYQVKQVKDYIVKKLKQNHMSAVWEVEDTKLIVYSLDERSLQESIAIVHSSVVENSLSLTSASQSLMQSEQWQAKVDELQAQFTGRVLIVPEHNVVKVCATDDIATEVLNSVKRFLRLNTIIENTVPFSKSITRLITSHHSNELEVISRGLRNQLVQISPKGTDSFLIKGTEDGVAQAKTQLQQLAARVRQRDHDICKPGLAFHMESAKGRDNINLVENSLPCVVEQKNRDSEDTYGNFEDEFASAPDTGYYKMTVPKTGPKIHASCRYSTRTIYAGEGDMTELTVDVLVNTSDEKLSLTGGLGKIIARKGGDVIQNACKEFIRTEGRLSEGESFICPAGQMSCKYIVHVVGPRWSGGTNNEEELLTQTVFTAMQQATQKSVTSMALPAISCGVYGYPVKRATAVIVAAVKNFFREVQETTIVTVYLCDIKGITVQHFTEAMKSEFGSGAVTEYKQDAQSDRPTPAPRIKGSMPTGMYGGGGRDIGARFKGAQKVLPTMTASGGGGGGVSFGMITVQIVKGEIAKQKVDVIVNTTAKNLDLKNGGVSMSLLRAAGPALQQEVTTKYPNGIRDGQIAESAGHDLQCGLVLHGALMNWDGGSGAVKALHDYMAKCLKIADDKGASSIAFPAIGTGNLGFPRDVVAKEMYNAVSDFSKTSNSVKDVRFIVYQKDFSTIKAFENVESSRNSSDSGPRQGRQFDDVYEQFRTSKEDSDSDDSDGSGIYEEIPADRLERTGGPQDGYQFGEIIVTVTSGDITQQQSDCIVNSSNEGLDLNRGAVSKALLRIGGDQLRQECEQKRKEMKRKHITVTSAPGLKCSYIIHIVAQDSTKDWKRMIKKCLEEAEGKGSRSIAFPALGTGLQMDASDIAGTMVNALEDFQASRPQNIRDVTIVVFQSKMVPQFEAAISKVTNKPKTWLGQIKNAAGSMMGYSQDSPRSKVKHHGGRMPPRNPDVVTFTIYAMEEQTINEAIRRLESSLEKEVHKKMFKDSIIKRLTDPQIQEIRGIAKNNHIEIDLRRDACRIEISGIVANVLEASDKIHQLLRDTDRIEQQKTEANMMTNLVQWYFIEVTNVKTMLVKYNASINLIIERAYQNQNPSATFCDSKKVKYVIDFLAMEEYPEGKPKDAVKVIRRDLVNEGAFERPALWSDMTENLKVVTLQSSAQEYKDIEGKFIQSSGGNFTVTKIDRIQNKTLWQQYLAKKKLLDQQNKANHQNEMSLWHGTAIDAVDSINAHGFNRSYCGKNATAFGDGVYFAVQASYSCSNTYSRPDSNNIKRMYLCKVLTGEYTLGKKGMRVPPAKPGGASSHALFDSVVNNESSPNMFIIFNDTQAYPEYLLCFKQN